jgi:hypothetical protein
MVARPEDRNLWIDYVSHSRLFVFSVGYFQFLEVHSALDTSDNITVAFDKKDIMISSDTVDDLYLCFVWFRKWILSAVSLVLCFMEINHLLYSLAYQKIYRQNEEIYHNNSWHLTFRNHTSYVSDRHTTTLQTPHFIYFFNKHTYWTF